MTWDYMDQLKEVDLGGGGKAYYVYSGGQRIRKVIENGASVKDRLYIGANEIYREKTSGSLTLERVTLHISDDTKRIAIVDTKTYDSGVVSSPTNEIRYQMGNHLQSASLELDGSANIITYEEFHPFGTSAYRLGNTATEVSQKRYRYVGKERDEETGMYYYGARYYAAWLCRFVSVDPLKDDYPMWSSFVYAGNSPVVFMDVNGMAPGDPEKPEDGGIIPKSLWLYDDEGWGWMNATLAGVIDGAWEAGASLVEMGKIFVKLGSNDMYKIEVLINLTYAVQNYEKVLDQIGVDIAEWDDTLSNSSGERGQYLGGKMLFEAFAAVTGSGFSAFMKTLKAMRMASEVADKVEDVVDKVEDVGDVADDVVENGSDLSKRIDDIPAGTRLPRTKGRWNGAPGESVWKSDIPEVNAITKGEGIPFKNAYPDFSKWSQGSFEIKGLTGEAGDFAMAHKRMVSEWGFPSQKAAADWLKKNKLTLHHHQDGKTLQLIPSDLHGNIPHSGGASLLRNN